MKKLVIPISILALATVGFILLLPNDKVEKEPKNTQEVVQTQNNEEIENKNQNTSSQEQEQAVESEVVTTSTSTGEIVNPITGETHPASYYDEVLADGYTYNNPAPIPEDWIIEPATDEYPATLDYEKMRAAISESYLLPGKISTMFSMVPEYMHGYTPRILFFRNENGFTNKTEFLSWLRQYIDSDIYFVAESKYNNRDGGKTWNIFMIEKNMNAIYDSYSRIKTDSMVSMRPWNQYLPQYRGTKELQDAIDATNRAVEE